MIRKATFALQEANCCQLRCDVFKHGELMSERCMVSYPTKQQIFGQVYLGQRFPNFYVCDPKVANGM